MFFYVTLQSALKPSLNDIRPTLVLFEGDKKKNSLKETGSDSLWEWLTICRVWDYSTAAPLRLPDFFSL